MGQNILQSFVASSGILFKMARAIQIGTTWVSRVRSARLTNSARNNVPQNPTCFWWLWGFSEQPTTIKIQVGVLEGHYQSQNIGISGLWSDSMVTSSFPKIYYWSKRSHANTMARHSLFEHSSFLLMWVIWNRMLLVVPSVTMFLPGQTHSHHTEWYIHPAHQRTSELVLWQWDS